MKRQVRQPSARGAFTLVELLVVILIIVVLVGLLLPVVGKIRTSARTASTQSLIVQLSNAINAYYTDFKAYPGPLSNTQVWNANNSNNLITIDTTATSEGYTTTQADFTRKITMSENLVLGLMGGLKVLSTGQVQYDPRLIGKGANSLKTSGTVKHFNAYIENASNLSWKTDTAGRRSGRYFDDAAKADDSIIPEFVDGYNDPLPILYLRAKTGVRAFSESNPADATEIDNTIFTYDKSDPDNRVGTYDFHQIAGYIVPDTTSGFSIGVGRKTIKYYNNGAAISPPAKPYHGLGGDPSGQNRDPKPTAVLGPVGPNYYYPYNAYPYFRSKSLSTPQNPVPHNKDSFILISAGPDRIYGTEDDITNFGEVGK